MTTNTLYTIDVAPHYCIRRQPSGMNNVQCRGRGPAWKYKDTGLLQGLRGRKYPLLLCQINQTLKDNSDQLSASAAAERHSRGDFEFRYPARVLEVDLWPSWRHFHVAQFLAGVGAVRTKTYYISQSAPWLAWERHLDRGVGIQWLENVLFNFEGPFWSKVSTSGLWKKTGLRKKTNLKQTWMNFTRINSVSQHSYAW